MKSNQKKKASRTNDLLPPVSAFVQTTHSLIEGEHPVMQNIDKFMSQISLDFGRSSGPGGQHRNRKATSCTATHIPTDISGESTERRRQSENRKMAISRLRRTLAVLLRRNIQIDTYTPSELWEGRRQGDQLPINPKHSDYACILAEALDVLLACDFDMNKSGKILNISNTQLLKIVSSEKEAITWFNNQRKVRELPTLKT
jgi:hypothetical protein